MGERYTNIFRLVQRFSFNRSQTVRRPIVCISYGQTDYFVDSGKYNFVESDPFRKYIRSVFSHNTISVDNQTYNFREYDFIGNPVIEKYGIGEDYSYVKAKVTPSSLG